MKTILATSCALLMSAQMASAQSLPGQPIQRTAGALSQGLNQTFQSARGITRQGFGTVQNATRNFGGSLGVGQRTYSQPYNQQFGSNQIGTQGYSTMRGYSSPRYQNFNSSSGVYQSGGFSTYGQSQPNYQVQSYGTQSYQSQPSYQHSGVAQTSYSQSQFDSSASATNQVHTLQYDESGREYINVNGQRIFFDGPSTTNQAASSGQSDQYRAGYGSYDQEGQNQSQSSSSSNDSNSPDVNSGQTDQSQSLQSNNSSSDDGANQTNRQSENDQNDSADQSSDESDDESSIDAEADTDAVDAGADFDSSL